MRKLKKLKLMVTALFLGIPISSVFVDNTQDANAAMKVGGAVSKLGTAIKPTLIKPTIAPKPTNIPKVPSHITQKLNQNKTTPTQSPIKNGLNQKINFFNNVGISTEKPQGPITQKVNKLNLSAKLPNTNGVNSSTGSLKQQPTQPKPEISRKLSLNSDFKNKLSSIFSEGNTGNNKLNPKQTKSPNKLNSDSVNKLEGLLGVGNKNSSDPSKNIFVNKDPSIPPAPPLPGFENKTTSSGNIPPAPPLPDKKPTLTTQTGSNNSNLQNQLNSKLNSGLNKTEQTITKKPLSKAPSSAQESLIAELQSKLNSRK